MTETILPYDPSGWSLDPLVPGSGFNVEPTVADEEELWYRSPFAMNGQWQPEAMPGSGPAYGWPSSGKPLYEMPAFATDTYPARSEKPLPRFENLQATSNTTTNNNTYTLDDLLRTASQLATERALYMNIPPATTHSPPPAAAHHHQRVSSPIADPYISSPASDDEHDLPAVGVDFAQVYRLPENNMDSADGYFSGLHQQPSSHKYNPAPASSRALPHSADNAISKNTTTPTVTATPSERKSNLTPLEMPDGTTRFTANWLPVDPHGGFTIRCPPLESGEHPGWDLMPGFHPDHALDYNYRNAFISLENLDNGDGGV
ncbi:hypothetical protein BJX61DRAFT_208687 [Aspergillus egyptiacus]|nr:hypothetical protein BJX61DRAFT_208687 [Aspergillus egyptiacus]